MAVITLTISGALVSSVGNKVLGKGVDTDGCSVEGDGKGAIVNTVSSFPTVGCNVNAVSSSPNVGANVNTVSSVPTVGANVKTVSSFPTVGCNVNTPLSFPTVGLLVTVIVGGNVFSTLPGVGDGVVIWDATLEIVSARRSAFIVVCRMFDKNVCMDNLFG